MEPTVRETCALRLCCETFALFNGCAADSRATADLLKVSEEWVSDAGSRSLVLPLLRAATLTVTSLPTMLSLTEVCVDAHFLHADDEGKKVRKN